MTLPPFDQPRARQATATLNGEPGSQDLLGSLAPPGSPASLGSAAPPGSPGSPGAPAAPVSPPQSRARPGDTEPEPLNLARRPFVNTRPVERVAAILWVLGVALLAANLTLFMGYLTNSQASRTKLAALERDIAQEQRTNAQLQGQVGKLGLDQQNREVTFLNRKIDERTFSWSLLFDRMAEVLPNQVRLLRLAPSNVVQREIGMGTRPSARELKPAPVVLTMHCEAKDDEAVLRFVDNLFAHPAFSEPNLENEERLDSGLLRFNITVQYQPNAPLPPTSPEPQTRTTRSRTRSTRTSTTSTPRTTRTLETLRPPRPARPPGGATAGAAGDHPAAPPPYPPPPVAPGAAAPSPGAGVPPAASPAGAGLMRVAPTPRRPGGGPRMPASPGVPGRPPAAAPGTAPPPPPPPLRGALPGAGNPPTPGASGMDGRR